MVEPRGTARQRILDSAVAVVREEGAGHLTLDSVARHAGLSKGGVLYHFPNKRALIEAMIERLLGNMEARADAQRQRIEGVNARLRALSLADATHLPEEDAMSLAILAASAEDPTLLNPVRETVAGWFAQVEGEAKDADVDVDAALLVLLANQGLRFMEMLELLPLKPARTRRLRERLLQLAEQQV
jgi:AcrR family transcriptional regulator